MVSKFIREIRGGFESSSTETPEWKSFFNLAKRHLNKTLNGVAEKIELTKGHYYFCGFFTRKSDGLILYLSSGDLRSPAVFVIRTAKSYTDYTGGTNHKLVGDSDFEHKLLRIIKSFKDIRSNSQHFVEELKEDTLENKN